MSADNQDFPDSGDDGRDRTWIAVHAASAILKASKELDTATIDRAGRVLIDIAEAHAKPVELPIVSISLCRRATDDEIAKARGEK